jgi:hypothetical protein
VSITLSLDRPVRARRRRFARAHAVHLLALHGGFAALIIAAVTYSREPAVVPQSVSYAALGGVARLDLATNGPAIGVDDPVAQFSQTRIGHILHAPYVGDHCRRVLFDNRNGAMFEALPRPCVQSAPEVSASTGADRLLALRKTFQK